MNLQILFEDNHIIVCHKPAGLPTQSARIGTPDMVSILKTHVYKNSIVKGEPYIAVIHRLDQPVEGILVFAKTPFAAKELTKQLQTNGFGKHYQALVCGIPPHNSGTLEDYVVKDAKTNTSRVCTKETPDSKKATLHYVTLHSFTSNPHLPEPTTLLQIHLETGRHHQIRVQLAHIGCPICGDTKYNTSHAMNKNWKQLCLYAYKLEFSHPKTKKPMVFQFDPEISEIKVIY